MAKPRMNLISFVGKLLEHDDIDALREGVRILANRWVSILDGCLNHRQT